MRQPPSPFTLKVSLLLSFQRKKIRVPFASPRVPASSEVSAADFESVFATGADNGMLTLCLGESQHRFTGTAFAVNMSFSVAVTVFPKLKETAEFFVFASAFGNIS